MGFLSDRDVGKEWEILLAKLLTDASIEVKHIVGNKYKAEWDVQSSLFGLDFEIEVKCDLKEAKTGNIAIEYHNPKSNKASGIKATTSQLWVVILVNPTTIWIASTSTLLTYISNKKCVRDIKCCGDKNASIKLFKRDKILKDVFHRIDDLDPWDLSTLLTKLLGKEYEKRKQDFSNSLQNRNEK